METNPANQSLGGLLLESFRKIPKDFIIQIDGETGESQTVEQVVTRSVQVAAGLRKLNVQVEDVVVIASHYSENNIAAIYGTLFQGAAPFPIEHNLKQHEFEHKLRISLPKVLFVTKDRVSDAFKALSSIGHRTHIFILDGIADCGLPFDEILDKSAVIDGFECSVIDDPGQRIAMILPSSGTTGLPKGVAGTHASYITQIRAIVCQTTPYLQITPPFWISGLLFVLLSPLHGFQRIYLKNCTVVNILTTIHKYKPQWASLSPMIMMKMLNYPELDKFELDSLSAVTSAGSTLPAYVVELVKLRMPLTELRQLYASTELAGCITMPCNAAKGSAGQLFPYNTCKVVDCTTRMDVGRNKEGEILLKSPTIMKCYLRNEEATRGTFDKDGFFLTGDLGHLDEDGFLFITGRLKERFLVRGVQVAPAELEDVIRGIAGVADAAVVAVPHETEQNHPRALVVKEKGATLTKNQVIDEVADKLSEEKQLFGGVQFVDGLPRNVNGKLLRLDLPKLVTINDTR